MTLEEAKDILLKLENLVAKNNRLYKKGERMDSMSFIKLHRKRICMFELQEEAECISLSLHTLSLYSPYIFRSVHLVCASCPAQV